MDFGERWEDVGLEDATAPKLTTKIYPQKILLRHAIFLKFYFRSTSSKVSSKG